MSIVFISGSRKISRLPAIVKARIDQILGQQLKIIIGDANGADKAVQNYLFEQQYEKVTVFCSGNQCRNNIGQWPVEFISVDQGLKGREFYTAKDKKMAEEANYGFVLWDGKSPGSYQNIIELLKYDKKSIVYFSPERSFYTIHHLEDAERLLNQCSLEEQKNIRDKIRLNSLIKAIESKKQSCFDF